MNNLTKSELNLLTQFNINQILDNNERTKVHSNRFSGEQIKVTALVDRVLDHTFYLLSVYETGQVTHRYTFIKSFGGIVKAFDRLKYLVLKLDRQAYMTLLD